MRESYKLLTYFNFVIQCRVCQEAGIRKSCTEFAVLHNGAAPGTLVAKPQTEDMRGFTSVQQFTETNATSGCIKRDLLECPLLPQHVFSITNTLVA